MIISASRRTDIPALYSDWFLKRIKEQYLYVRNPMNIHQVSKINLSPEVVDCIVFWTKNASPIISKLDSLIDYKYYFQYTITNYPKYVEPQIPDFPITFDVFKKISTLIGRNRIIWRYDPIVLTNEFDIKWHVKNFTFLCEKLTTYTNKCVLSFVDYYKNTKSNMTNLSFQKIDNLQMLEIAHEIKVIADKYHVLIESCAEKIDLESIGINHGKCIDDKLVEEIINCSLKVVKDKNQRPECGCVASIDIGSYNTCTNGCIYCYANTNTIMASNNNTSHNSKSPLLFGNIETNDTITERECISCKVFQKNLFNN